MNKLLMVGGLLAVFSSPSYAKEKETFIGQDGKLHCLHTDGMVRDGACACMPDTPGSCAKGVGPGATAALPRKSDAKITPVHSTGATQQQPMGDADAKPGLNVTPDTPPRDTGKPSNPSG